MNVQFIEKVGEGKKNFDTVQEGDVVILPAFGASFEEMNYFDEKVRPPTSTMSIYVSLSLCSYNRFSL